VGRPSGGTRVPDRRRSRIRQDHDGTAISAARRSQWREPTLYVTLAESRDELEIVAESHEFDIAKVEIFEVKPPELDQTGSDQYTVFHPSEVELVDVMQNILSKMEKTKAGRIVFDSMSEIRMLARDPLRYRRQILSLKQFFMGRKCTVLLECSRPGPISP
jgi:circadian clock protein KaiC